MILWFLFNFTHSQRPECEVPAFALEPWFLNAFLYTAKDQINLHKNPYLLFFKQIIQIDLTKIT